MMVVIGGSGFFGSHLSEKLCDIDKVRILDIAPPPKELLKRVDFIKGDVRNASTVYDACKGADVVYNVVALVPLSRAGKLFREVNVNGVRNVLEASLKNHVNKVVHISTSAIFGVPKKVPIDEKNGELNPMGEYGRTKLEGEMLCQKYMKRGLKITILRPRAIIGPGRLGVFGILYDWIMKGKNIYIIGPGNNRYQMLSTDDLVEACILAIDKGSNEVFHLGSDKYSTVREELEELVAYAKTGSKVISLNPALIIPILKVLDFLNLSPLVDWHYLGGGKDFIFDTTKAKKILGWTPKYGDTEMLIAGYNWYLEHYEEIKSKVGTTHTQMPRQGILKLISLLS
jgi:nucleoside-diphosphate-sugar epimerase